MKIDEIQTQTRNKYMSCTEKNQTAVCHQPMKIQSTGWFCISLQQN